MQRKLNTIWQLNIQNKGLFGNKVNENKEKQENYATTTKVIITH